jgi:tetratricopeptide (TPR) repeat protein
MASSVYRRRFVVISTVTASLLACQKPKADTKAAPIPGLDPGKPAKAATAVFVRESLAATREALHSAYRMALDARIAQAAAAMATLLGVPLAQSPSVTWKSGWQVRSGAVVIGDLDELPDFDQANAMLVAWAGQQLAAHPMADDAGPFVSPEFLFDQAAVRGMRQGAKLCGIPANRARGIHELSVSMVSLGFQALDAMQASDSLLAAAWAATALDQALGHAQVAQQSLLAFALGYRGAAQRLAARLPETSPVRAYLLNDNVRLSALAAASDSDTGTRYLWLRRLLLDGRSDEAQRWEQARLAEVRATMPIVQAKIMWGDFEMRRALAGSAPSLVVWSAYRDADSARAERVAKSPGLTGGESEAVVYGRLGVEPARALSAFDETLASIAASKADPIANTLAAYYRGAMLTALRDKGQDYLHTLSSNTAAAAFARSLSDDQGETATTFRRWFDYLVAANAGQNVTGKLLENVQALPGIGGLALIDIFQAIQSRLDWADPATYAAARAVVSRLDSRPANRKTVGDIAHRLPDLLAFERLYRSLIEAAPGAYPAAQVYLATFTGDRALFDATLALPQLGACQHIDLLEARVGLGQAKLEPALREMEAAAREDGDTDGIGCLISVLNAHQHRADVVRVARAWLAKHRNPRGLDGVDVSRRLAQALRQLGRHEDALRAIEPAARSGQGSAMMELARVHAALGQAEKARAMAESIGVRYPGAGSVAGRAEIAWRLGQPAEAVRILAQAKLRTLDYLDPVAPAFVGVFMHDKVPGIEAAAQEIFKSNLPGEAKEYFIGAVGHVDAKQAVALIDLLTSPSDRQHAALRDFTLVRTVKGDAAAETWGREQLRLAPVSFSTGAIVEHQEDPLWLLPEPGPGPRLDLLWLFRAVAAQWQPPSRHLAALKQHFAAPGTERYYRFGRLVMGLEDEAAGTAMRGSTPSQACEAAFYLGARAQGLGKLDDAHAWYRAAIETSLPGESEYRFALAQMSIWAAQGKSLARITKAPPP